MTDAGFRARVIDIRDEASGVRSFAIQPMEGGELPLWAAGAHVDLALRPGLGRQYSICGHPDDPSSLRFAVLREIASRGGSAFLHDEVAVGDEIEVVAVRNNFPLTPGEETLLVAGGIGVTPLLAMARELEGNGARWRMLYGGRSRDSMAFLDELSRYGDKVLVRPQDEFGLLDLGSFLGEATPDKVVYCCGPEPLIKAVETYCAAWPEGSLQIERFRPSEPLADSHDDRAFEVELRQSGKTIQVPPGVSIADAMEAVGVVVPRSCNEGTCGTCLTRVIEGLPDHRDSFLRPKQRDKNNLMLVCRSRSLTPRLVLDV